MRKPAFFSEFLGDSMHVGSVIPSSDFLTRKMLPVSLPWHKMKQLAELGPGTGVFTKHIEHRRSRTSRFYLFERNQTFRKGLQLRYPDLIIRDDALQLSEIVNETGRKFDLIVSGLPFANFNACLQEELFSAIRSALADHGTFVAFQYTPLLWNRFQAHFPKVDAGYTLMNVPPAWVFRCNKKGMPLH